MSMFCKWHAECERCRGRSKDFTRDAEAVSMARFVKHLADLGWEGLGVGDVITCPECAIERSKKRARAGFTLIELLVVIVIIAVVLVAVGPALVGVTVDRRLTGGAAVAQAAIVTARDRATNRGEAGFRLEPDPAWELVRLADATIDPAYPLAYSRIVPLTTPPPYEEGLASVHTDGFPAAFVPLYNRLVLEEAHYADDDPGATTPRRVSPTSWWWNVRVGEIVTFQGRPFTITGPMVVLGDQNPEGFVNVGLPGAVSPLDRGDGPREFLYLANRVDDPILIPIVPTPAPPASPFTRIPPDGMVDSGWNGGDDDLDGLVDEDDEWEAETWTFLTPTVITTGTATIARRPVADLTAAVELPAGSVIDATGWATQGYDLTDAGGDPDYRDRRIRSQVPVNLYTGAVDVVFDAQGRADYPTWYGRPAAGRFGRSFAHLWIAQRSAVAAPAATAGEARLVSLDRFTGRVAVTEADAAEPAAAMVAVEGGAR